jgi:hypothetical protein
MTALDCPASFMTWAKLCALALSPPSLTTISTFLSRLPACNSSSPWRWRRKEPSWPLVGVVAIAFSSSAALSVNRIAPGRPSDTFSLKLTTNISSSRLLDRTKARAAAVTSASFGRMLVLWSTTSPTVTGTSSF